MLQQIAHSLGCPSYTSKADSIIISAANTKPITQYLVRLTWFIENLNINSSGSCINNRFLIAYCGRVIIPLPIHQSGDTTNSALQDAFKPKSNVWLIQLYEVIEILSNGLWCCI